jgi:hypothetical protein
MGFLTEEERGRIRQLKEEGVLRKFTPDFTKGIAKNGGILIACSDGDITLSDYYKEAISDRPHSVKTFGGTLNICPDFRGFDPEEESVILKNVVKGFKAKKTRTLFLGHHYPCGMASAFNHSLDDVLTLNCLAHIRFDFLHVKRVNKGNEPEENMYSFDPDLYAEIYL